MPDESTDDAQSQARDLKTVLLACMTDWGNRQKSGMYYIVPVFVMGEILVYLLKLGSPEFQSGAMKYLAAQLENDEEACVAEMDALVKMSSDHYMRGRAEDV